MPALRCMRCRESEWNWCVKTRAGGLRGHEAGCDRLAPAGAGAGRSMPGGSSQSRGRVFQRYEVDPKGVGAPAWRHAPGGTGVDPKGVGGPAWRHAMGSRRGLRIRVNRIVAAGRQSCVPVADSAGPALDPGLSGGRRRLRPESCEAHDGALRPLRADGHGWERQDGYMCRGGLSAVADRPQRSTEAAGGVRRRSACSASRSGAPGNGLAVPLGARR